MSGGADSTFIIYPEGLASLTVATDANPATSPYLLLSGTLDFHEEQRRVDNDRTGADLRAPITFWLAIKHTTREGMITAYNDLDQALANEQGGRIAFKPDGLDAGVLTTYYHYVKSPPPELLKRKNNRWDASPKADGYYTIYVDVQILTYPIATSDPDNPVTLSDLATTIDNWVDDSPAQTNRVTVLASNLKGSQPALVRLLAQPGAGQYLGRLIIFKRDEGTLANFVNVLEAEDASVIYPSVAWTEVASASRGDGNYMQCLPATDANGAAQGLRFTIANPGDHKGRFAVFGIGYDSAEALGVWTHQVKIGVGNSIVSGRSDWAATILQSWHAIYAGEFELPPVPLSALETGYDTGPYLEWYSTRSTGATEFRLDGIVLVYVSDSKFLPTALDVTCDDEDGVTNSEQLLIENFPSEDMPVRELAHVVAQSDGDFKRALLTAPHGDFLTLDPTKDTLLVFLQEQKAAVILDDDFGSYKYSRWMPVDDLEDLSGDWTIVAGGAAADPTYYVEGTQGIRQTVTGGVDAILVHKSVFDLEHEGRFTDDDFTCLAIQPETGQAGNTPAHMYWYTSAGNYYSWELPGLSEAWNFLMNKKSAYLSTGSPDWATVYPRLLIGLFGDGHYNTWDYLRIEKADPDDANNPNATGTQWDFQPVGGYWTITEDVSGAGATLACLDLENNVEKAALIDETTPADVKFRAKVMAKKNAGFVGIVWRAGDDTLTEGAEDCYAAFVDTSAGNHVNVRKYTNGAATQLDSADFTTALDTWYTIGVIAKGSSFRVYATASSNLTDDDDVFSADYLLSTVTDATYTSGKCGVMCINTLGRFDEVKLVSLQDKMIPADQITLSGKAIFRTIAPFVE